MKDDNMNNDFGFNIDNDIDILYEDIDINDIKSIKKNVKAYSDFIAEEEYERLRALERDIHIKKLEKIMEGLKGQDPKVVEDNFFKKVECNTEKEKIILEIKYIKTKLLENMDKFIIHPNYNRKDEHHAPV